MNEWVEKSIVMANAPRYLDRLQQVYPVVQEPKRQIGDEVKANLRKVFQSGNDVELVKELLKLPKFPVKDPYVAFLRKREFFVEHNPETVRRIASRIRSMGYEGMIESIEQPKEFNRQMGPLFRRWLATAGYPILSGERFVTYRGIALLHGTDRELKDFANESLGCQVEKEPDFIAKVGQTYLVGEAKFLTDVGGHQNAQFQDALRWLEGPEGRAVRVAVLDGVVWISDGTKMYRTVCALEKVALSALLLGEFLQSLSTG